VEGALDAVRPAVEAKAIRLQNVLDPRAGPITGDPARLQQVVWNLLMNAVKFTPKGGRVQVHVQRVNSHVEIVVSDTGQGIAPEMLPLIFDRFRQADSSSTRAHTGLGLGLALVRHLVELHGGTARAPAAIRLDPDTGPDRVAGQESRPGHHAGHPGCQKDHVYGAGRMDEVEGQTISGGEDHGGSRAEDGSDVMRKHPWDDLIGKQHEDEIVGRGHREWHDLEAIGASAISVLILSIADPNLCARVA
jgi:hypothetical protein